VLRIGLERTGGATGRRRPVLLAAASLAVVLSVGACRDGSGAPREGAPTTVAAAAVPDPQPTPRAELADAVRDLLDAEKRGDRAASFLLLSRQSRLEYRDVADWTTRRQQLPSITGFRIDPSSEGERGQRAGKVVAVVEHVPGLDPFKGLSPAQERLTFTGRREGDGWLVDGDAESEPILPSDALAVEAATAWVTAVQACARERATELQAVPTLFGSADGAAGLCGKAGTVATQGAGPLTAGVASTDIVAQYSTDALLWARVVRVTSPGAFGVVLAPIGPRWQVLGLID
jgi:hypothetical protein